MSALQQQRCFNHGLREAVARCPSCSQYFCRECVTEHDDRMVCAACLEKQLGPARAPGRSGRLLLRITQAVMGFMILWMGFYLLGQVLLDIPSKVHEGTLWEDNWWEMP